MKGPLRYHFCGFVCFLFVTLVMPFSLNKFHDKSLSTFRSIAQVEKSCKEAIDDVLTRKIEPNQKVLKESRDKFWKKHGAVYLSGKFEKNFRLVAKKLKIYFMKINGSPRPIYYIEKDEAYIKIFKYIDEVTSGKISKVSDDVVVEETVEATTKEVAPNGGKPKYEFSELDHEVYGWIKRYRSYESHMNSFIEELASNSSVMDELKKLKKDKNLKFPIKISYKKYNDERIANDYLDDISDVEEIDEILIRLKSRNEQILGGLIRGQGKIAERDFEQALLNRRLDYLKREVRDALANDPELAERLNPIIRALTNVLADKDLKPTVWKAMVLEVKEARAEWGALFEKGKLNYDKLKDSTQAIVDNLSPAHKEKIGLGTERKWANSLRYGRWGVFLAPAAGGGYSAIVYAYNWFYFHQNKKYDIVNAKSESDFIDNLNEYLRNNFPMEMTMRLHVSDKREISLKDFNPKNKKDIEFLETVREIISLRKKYKHDERVLEAVQQKFADVIDDVNTTTEEPDETISTEPEEPKVDDSPGEVISGSVDDKRNNKSDTLEESPQEATNSERRKKLHDDIRDRRQKRGKVQNRPR